MSRWRVQIRSVPKRDEPAKHNKDRTSVGRPGWGSLRLAVADGASQAYKADVWAKLLVDAWTQRRLDTTHSNARIAATIGRLGAVWGVDEEPSSHSPWYVAAKASRGSFATLLGVDLRYKRRAWRWRALAVGDTELFVIDASYELRIAYPVARSADFGPAPMLLSTGRRDSDLPPYRHMRASGLLPAGGRLVLATDALAKCLLAAHEDGKPLWAEAIAAGGATRTFIQWIRDLRANGRLDDDDTTLLIAERTR